MSIIITNLSAKNAFNLLKILINSESAINLIVKRVVEKIRLQEISDNSLTMKIASDAEYSLNSYCYFRVVVAGVSQDIDTHIISGNTSYSLLLGCT